MLTQLSRQPSNNMIRAGIISDTHLMSINDQFKQMVAHCFAGCDAIIHAGDLTDISILKAFPQKTIHAVHGNMCNIGTRNALTRYTTFQLGAFSFGLAHGAGLGYDIESGLWDIFPEVDCIIYGHTHRAICHRQAGRLIINPGSFQSTGRYGAPGSYGIIEIGEQLRADIHEVPQTR